jgi:hypothetical protein
MGEQLDAVLSPSDSHSVTVPLAKIKSIANEQPYYKYNQIWSKNMENVSFCYVLRNYIQEEKLLSYEQVAQNMGGQLSPLRQSPLFE